PVSFLSMSCLPPLSLSFFLHSSVHHRALPSFPTRRSSDLRRRRRRIDGSRHIGGSGPSARRGNPRRQPRQRGAVVCPHDRGRRRSEEHTSELQSRGHLVCRLLLEKKKKTKKGCQNKTST